MLYGIRAYRPRRVAGESTELSVGRIFGQHENFRPAVHEVLRQARPFLGTHGRNVAQGEKARFLSLAVDVGQILTHTNARRDAQPLRKKVAQYASRRGVLTRGKLLHGFHVLSGKKRREFQRPGDGTQGDVPVFFHAVLSGGAFLQGVFVVICEHGRHDARAYGSVAERNGYAKSGLPRKVRELFGREIAQRGIGRRA